MITNNEKWHYLSVKSLSALFKGQNSKDNGDFSCLNCLHSFRTKKKKKQLKRMKIYVKTMIIAVLKCLKTTKIY